jgi:predicted amidohydrolase
VRGELADVERSDAARVRALRRELRWIAVALRARLALRRMVSASGLEPAARAVAVAMGAPIPVWPNTPEAGGRAAHGRPSHDSAGAA